LDIGDGYLRSANTSQVSGSNFKTAESAAISAGHNNHLQVIAKGNQFTFNVNGETVKTFSDGDFASGNLGLTGGSLFENAGVHIAFDNLTERVKP
jgi:hypothetical protein